MLKPYTHRQLKLIVGNILNACKDINELKPIGYKFIHIASGFIAHYNINGFKCYYSRPENNLARDILKNVENNQYSNFDYNHNDFDYYRVKRKIYNLIVEGINQYGLYLKELDNR